MWFLGNDLLAILWNNGWKDEKRSINKIENNPNRHFLKQRSELEPILEKHMEYYRKLNQPFESKISFPLSSFDKA